MKINKNLKNTLTNNYLFFIAILILSYLIYILYTNYFKNTPISITKQHLYKILAPGNYTGKATIDPTTQYKNGLICTHHLTITKHPDGLTVINRFKAFDPNTHKLQYQGYRDIKFLYKPNHPNQLFKISKSYINDKIVSSSYGYATGKTKNSILFHLTGSWHVDNRDFHKITWTARRTNTNTLQSIFTHPHHFGLNAFTIHENYTQQN